MKRSEKAKVNSKGKATEKSQIVKDENIEHCGAHEKSAVSSEPNEVVLGGVDRTRESARTRNITCGIEPRMSSLEIAEITGKTHQNVMRGIRNGLKKAGIVESKFREIYFDSIGRSQPCYHLPWTELFLSLPRYPPKLRLAIIDRWYEIKALHPKPKIPANFSEALRAKADEIERLEAEAAAVKYVGLYLLPPATTPAG